MDLIRLTSSADWLANHCAQDILNHLRKKEHKQRFISLWYCPPWYIFNEQPWISKANKRGHYRRATGSSNLFLRNMQAQACLCLRKRHHSLLCSLQDYGSLPLLVFNKQSELVFFLGFFLSLSHEPIVESTMQQLRSSPQVPVPLFIRLGLPFITSATTSGHNQRGGGSFVMLVASFVLGEM